MFDLIVLALADYRLSLILSKDTISEDLRARLGRRAYRGGAWKFAADLINCPYCVGVWGALFLTMASKVRPGKALAYVLAVAGLQDVLQGLLWGDDEE
jgi:hypothetical protein